MSKDYDVKYAIMPLYVCNGTLTSEINDDLVAYIVSKCYIVNKVENGYEVLFPYQKVDATWCRIKPDTATITLVDEVFTTFDEGLNKTNKLNKQLLSQLRINKQYDLYDISRLCKELEDQIEAHTSLSCSSKEKSIIVTNIEQDVIVNMSLYDFIALVKDQNFFVCTISEKQFELMQEQIKTDGQLSERNAFAIAPCHMFNYLMVNDLAEQKTIIMDSKHNQNVCLEGDKISKIPFVKDSFSMKVTGLRICTPLTYEEVIEYYSHSMKSEIKVKSIGQL